MNSVAGKEPISKLTSFKGLWSRGAYESCPQDHLTDCFNCVFPSPGQVSIREPISTSSIINTRTIISYSIATVSGGGACLLTLNSDGKFYNESVGPTLLGTISGTAGVLPDDFTVINMFGRTYISFKKGGKALAGTSLYYFDGANFHLAAGAAPVAGPVLAQVNAGNVDPGVHGVAVCFQSRTGYLSPPSTITNITSTGVKDIELSVIPVGGADCVARVLVMTKANELELFFVPGGTINDNVTTVATINVYDSSLLESADYLNNLLTIIPACSAMRFYRGRTVLIGQLTTPDIIMISRVDDPESFDRVNGALNFPVDYGINTCNSGLVIRDTLYITKPNGTYSTQDNGGEPGTWAVSIIDSGIGAWDNGVTLFASSMAASDVLDSSFVCSKRGLMLFNGAYSDTALTYKIESLWQLINVAYFYKVQISHDVWLKRIYIAVPLSPPVGQGTCSTNGTAVTWTSGDSFFPGSKGMSITINGAAYVVSAYNSATGNITLKTSAGVQADVNFSLEYPGKPFVPGAASLSCVLMMDYSDGLNAQAVKWSVWTSQSFGAGIYKMSVENFTLSYVSTTIPIYQLSFCTGSTTVFKVLLSPSQGSQTVTKPDSGDANAANNATTPINQYVTTAPVPSNQVGVFTFNMLDLNLYGNGVVYMSTLSKNRTAAFFVSGFNLSSYAGQGVNFQRLINTVSENMQVILQSDQNKPEGLNGFIQPVAINIYATKMWAMRPALTENA